MSVRFLLSLSLVFVFAAFASGQGRVVESYRGHDAAGGEIIVRFRAPDAAASRKKATQVVESDRDISSVETLGSAGAVKLRSRGRSVAALVDAYSRRADVLYAEPNYIVRAADLPNDVYFDRQWSLRNTGQVLDSTTLTPGKDIKAEAAWNITEGDRAIVVGVVDSGVAYLHPDLAPNMWSAPAEFSITIDGRVITCPQGSHGFNAILKNCDPVDEDGHGTHVAGVIGAAGNNGAGISGINRVSSIMALKFLDIDGFGEIADAVAAIEFAIRTKAVFGSLANVRVLNASWGGRAFSQALADQMNLANSHDMLFVTAAGNDGRSIENLSEYPASYSTPNLITVAATTGSDALATFSNYGATKVHLGAPGVDIFSTHRHTTYRFASGTSVATAMVSGAAALVLAGCPSLDTANLKFNLINPASLDPLAALSGKTLTGGRLNVLKALINCGATTPSTFFLTVGQRLKAVGVSGGRVTSIVSLAAQNGFSSPVLLTVNAPAGITVSLVESTLIPGAPTTEMTVDAMAGLSAGTYLIHITGTSGGIAKKTAMMLSVLTEFNGSQLSGEQTVTGALSDATSQRDATYLSKNDWEPFDATRFADLYRLFLSEPRQVVFTHAAAGYIPKLYVRNADGSLRAGSGSLVINTVTLTTTLPAGEYLIEATSAGADDTGHFYSVSLSMSIPPPTLTSLTPAVAARGSSELVTFTGTAFYNPLTPAGPSGFTFTEVVVVNSTTATARLSIGASVAPSDIASRYAVGVRTPSGASSNITFVVLDHPPAPPVITGIQPNVGNQGRTVRVTFTGLDFMMPITFDTGPGITVSNIVSQQLNSVAVTFAVATDAPLGERQITLTSALAPGQVSNPVTFTIRPPFPTITGLTPSKAFRGRDINVVLAGTSFDSTLTIAMGTEIIGGLAADPSIAVDNVIVVSPTMVTATIHVAADAALGFRDIRVTTLGGLAQFHHILEVVPFPPVLTGISPAVGQQGTSVDVTLTGTFEGPFFSVVAQGLSMSSPVIVGDGLKAQIVISSNAALGPHNVVVSNSGGSSGPLAFNVILRVPTVSSMSPSILGAGAPNNVTLTGAGFISGSTSLAVSGSGVTVSNVNVSSGSSMTATITVAADATLGTRSLTLTNAGGTGPEFPFTLSSSFPDLALSSSHTGNFAAGFNESYTVLVRNIGSGTTTGPITLTDILPTALSFISGTGNGWSCVAVGQSVQCMNAGPINAGESSTISMSVRATRDATVTHTVSVSTPGDLIPSNNSANESITILFPPTPTFVLPFSIAAGQQSTVGVRISNPFFHDLTGTVTLLFTPSGPNPADDPSIQFATGGRQVTFTIPANTTQARFGTLPVAGPVGFQAGSVAGGIRFEGTVQSGAVLPLTNALTIPNQAPAIISAVSDTDALIVTLLSTTRQVDSVELFFIVPANAEISCASIVSCTASGSTITLDVRPLFQNWFASGDAVGSLSQLRLPVLVNGVVGGRVVIRLRNTMGLSSSTVPISLP